MIMAPVLGLFTESIWERLHYRCFLLDDHHDLAFRQIWAWYDVCGGDDNVFTMFRTCLDCDVGGFLTGSLTMLCV